MLIISLTKNYNKSIIERPPYYSIGNLEEINKNDVKDHQFIECAPERIYNRNYNSYFIQTIKFEKFKQ